MKFNFVFFLLVIFSLISVHANSSSHVKNEIFDISKIEDYVIIRNYKKYKKEFSKKLCTPGTEKKFWKMYKAYRGDGHYIPLFSSGKLDRATIEKYIPELKQKSKWIKNQITVLKKRKKSPFKTKLVEINGLENKLQELVELKALFIDTLSMSKKEKIQSNSLKEKNAFFKKVESLLNKYPHLLSYKFPLDHLGMRKKYDKYKVFEDFKNKKKSNDIYFYRQIVQDGALDRQGKRSDRSFRATLDTIALSIKRDKDFFISENLRFDLESIFKKYKKYLKKHKSQNINSLKMWKKRNDRKISFYKKLTGPDKKNINRAKKILLKKSSARYELKDYVLKKEALSFKYWSEKAEVYRALYTIETLLFGEVGDFEKRKTSERLDIVRLILNRLHQKEYSVIRHKDMIFPYLNKLYKGAGFLKYKWLNLLFKEGEFSFTYFFLEGNLRIYCPSQTKKARYLENTNLKIALSVLRSKNFGFEGIRYYSRASMLGRIDMSSLWYKFDAIGEKPGVKVLNTRYLKSLYSNKKFRNLYSFKDKNERPFRVIEIKNKNYVLPYGKTEFFHHRNPHYFKYFKVK